MAKQNEVILLQAVDGLGLEGDVVKVKDGYARNYLVPQQLAALLSPGTRKLVDKKRKEREIRLAREKETALALQKKLEAVACRVKAKVGAEGKLFGSVTNAHIVEALKALGFELDKHQLQLAEPIRQLGDHLVAVKLHPEVQVQIKVQVVEETP